jgi:hypothetical protein
VSKNNVTDTSSIQTLTNKTINSNNNTIIAGAVSGTPNLNTVLNQNVSITATPQFEGYILNNLGTQCYREYSAHGNIPANTTVNILTFVLPVGQSVSIITSLSAHCITGANQGYSVLESSFKLVNDGTVSGSAGNYNLVSDANLIGLYAGNLTTNITVSGGNNVNVQLISTLLTGSITYGGSVDVSFA